MLRKSVLLLLFLGAVSCSCPVKNLDYSGEAIICFGNSITKGVGVSESYAYPSFLAELLNREVINAGVSGDTTFTALKRMEEDVLNKNPALVVIELGGNDFLQKIPKRVTLTNLEEIIVRIQERGALVVLCDISGGHFLAGYRKEFKKLARKTHCLFVSGVLDGILNNSSLKSDYIHPNTEGYKLIAQRVNRAIKDYVK